MKHYIGVRCKTCERHIAIRLVPIHNQNESLQYWLLNESKAKFTCEAGHEHQYMQADLVEWPALPKAEN